MRTHVALLWLCSLAVLYSSCDADSTPKDPADVLADSSDITCGCGARACGPSPCGERCGDCPDDAICTASGRCEAVVTECTGKADGTACGASSAYHCLASRCVVAYCGDGYVDTEAGEACDDGNRANLDGCNADCQWSCTSNADCSSEGDECGGLTTCQDHMCVQGEPLEIAASCTTRGGVSGLCRSDSSGARWCVPPGCGNGALDDGETCDDGNLMDGDGCDLDCTWSCTQDSDCEDGDVCNGLATCHLPTHICVPGTPLDCTDADACTANLCDPLEGCSNPLVDADGDGHAPMALGLCGTDCNDNDDVVFEGAEELCDQKDNNCDGETDEGQPTWYCDHDKDGYAPAGATTEMGCAEPNPTPECPDWTARAPGPESDCDDADALKNPGATEAPGDEVDSNCDGKEICFKDADNDGYVTNSSNNKVTSSDADCGDFGEARSNEPRTDCNDGNSAIHPGGIEVCNGEDDDCDNATDENIDWPYADSFEPNESPVSSVLFEAQPLLESGSVRTGPATFHSASDRDYFHAATGLYDQFWKCRITGMPAGLTVEVELAQWTSALGWRAPVKFAGVGNNQVLSYLALPGGAIKYLAGVTPDSGVWSCAATYELECKLAHEQSGF